jgi:hypothetical protein
MERMRISTTVDGTRLARARELFAGRDAAMLDQALAALIDEIETAREIAAIRALPYHADPMLDLPVIALADDLPYDGEVPADVLAAVEQRRTRRRS